jgi:hypothetical protein
LNLWNFWQKNKICEVFEEKWGNLRKIVNVRRKFVIFEVLEHGVHDMFAPIRFDSERPMTIIHEIILDPEKTYN